MPCWIEFDLFPPLSETWQKKKACWHGRLTRKDTHLTVERLVPLTQLCHFSPWASVFPSVQREGWSGPLVVVMLRVPVTDSLLKTEIFKLPWFFLEILIFFFPRWSQRESFHYLRNGPTPMRSSSPQDHAALSLEAFTVTASQSGSSCGPSHFPPPGGMDGATP